MKTIILYAMLSLMLSACATKITPRATSGSKSDGIVTFTYNYTKYEYPVIDWITLQVQADERCAAWGYSDSKAFEGTESSCISGSADNCEITQVKMNYQCLL